MQILRMENANGVGPFEYGNSLSTGFDEQAALDYWEGFSQATGWLGMKHGLFGDYLDIPRDHMPHGDDIPDNGGWQDESYQWKVGVPDMKQFNHWFPEKSYPFFRKQGFELVTYEAPARYVHLGGHQLIFCVTDAKVVERRPL